MRLLEKRIHDDGSGSIVVAAVAAASPTRYFWNCRIRHSGDERVGFSARVKGSRRSNRRDRERSIRP